MDNTNWSWTRDMSKVNEQAIKHYFRIVSYYCNKIVEYFNLKYDANINDVRSLIHFQTMNRIWKFVIEDTEILFHGTGCSAYKNCEEICGWDFSGNGYWSVIVDVYKVTLTLKHISEYGEVEVEDIRELSDRLVHNGILEKTSVTTYRVKTEHECDFCCRIDISQ